MLQYEYNMTSCVVLYKQYVLYCAIWSCLGTVLHILQITIQLYQFYTAHYIVCYIVYYYGDGVYDTQHRNIVIYVKQFLDEPERPLANCTV